MRLSQASDFALRILMYVGQRDDPQTVDLLATHLALAKSHVMKIVAQLARSGFLATTRGRGGGISLAMKPDTIHIGSVVRAVEPDFAIVACLHNEPTACSFLPRCALKGAMADAADAFVDSLNRHTLADILTGTQPARSQKQPGDGAA